MCKVTQLVSVKLRFPTAAARPGIWALDFEASAAVCFGTRRLEEKYPALSSVACGVLRVGSSAQEDEHRHAGPVLAGQGFSACLLASVS